MTQDSEHPDATDDVLRLRLQCVELALEDGIQVSEFLQLLDACADSSHAIHETADERNELIFGECVDKAAIWHDNSWTLVTDLLLEIESES